MRKIKRFAVLTLMITLRTEAADSCSCIPRSVTQQVREADFVFRGKVLSRLPAPVDLRGMEVDGESVNFQIEHVYKGKVGGQRVRIGVVYGGSACGYYFKSQQSYLVFANRSAHSLKATFTPFTYSHYSGLCHGNQPFSSAREMEIERAMKPPFIWK